MSQIALPHFDIHRQDRTKLILLMTILRELSDIFIAIFRN